MLARFRWVQLQLAIFLNENPPLRLPEDVEDKIEKIKNEVGLPVLNAVYNEVYDMNTHNSRRGREYAVRAYRILLCALQPLTVQMLAEAVSLDLGGKRNPHVNEKYVMAICSTFIVADDEGIVRFAHLSVAEYLRSQTFTELYSDAYAHAQAAEACLLHIVHRLPALHNSNALTGPKLSPFSDYAILFGLTHYELTSQELRLESHRALLLSDFFGLTTPSLGFDLWTMLLNRSHNGFLTFSSGAPQGVRQRLANAFKPQPTIISVSCAWGFAEIVETILVVKDSSPETSKESLQAGLCIASKLGHVEVAKILLEKGGADANYQEKPSDPPAIFGAVLANDLAMLDLLLKHGADVEAGGPGGLTPLQVATRGSRNEGVVQCLIKNGAKAFVEDTFEWRLLHQAAYHNDPFLVRLLLDMAIDPNKVDLLGETALRGTFRPGFEDGHEETGEIVKILLEKLSAAPVVSQDCYGRSALLRADSAGLTSIVRVFIDAIDIKALSQLGREEVEKFTVLLQALKGVDPERLESRLSKLQNIACVDSAGLVQYLKGDDEELNMMRAQGYVTSRFTEEF